ncbi:MAG: VOC family protein [Microthrixaceae bacterium]
MLTPAHANGAPCWLDLLTDDVEAAKAFYEKLFGWSYVDTGEEFGNYVMASLDDVPVAGLMKKQSPQMPNTWAVYLSTDDAEAVERRAVAHHGAVLVEPMKLGPRGTMAVVVDPAGAVVGTWQPDDFHGFGRAIEHGAPCWFETLSRSYDAALPFYQDVFGWDVHTTSDDSGFRYSTLGEGDNAKAGIMDAAGFPPEIPSLWQFYLGCTDVDASAAAVIESGGTLLRPLEDTPYGRIAAVTDPTGAQFCVTSFTR